MSSGINNRINSEVRLALAWCNPEFRGRLLTSFQLDRRLAQIVSRTTEPMFGQMRLAWWRDALSAPVAHRPKGDAVLDSVGEHWAGDEARLVAMVDGWEAFMTAEQLGLEEAASFGAGRGAFFAAIIPSSTPSQSERLLGAGARWALADAAAAVSDEVEQDVLITVGLGQADSGPRIPSAIRGLAILDALARRALARGGRPLMEGRGASITALRAAIFRR